MVSTPFVAKCKSKEILVVNIRERIDKIQMQEEEATPHKPADLETWWLCVRKVLVDLLELPMGVPLASTHIFRINTDHTSKLPHPQPYRMSDSEALEFGTQFCKFVANGWVTDSHS
jgi:hypothetical protein